VPVQQFNPDRTRSLLGDFTAKRAEAERSVSRGTGADIGGGIANIMGIIGDAYGGTPGRTAKLRAAAEDRKRVASERAETQDPMSQYSRIRQDAMARITKTDPETLRKIPGAVIDGSFPLIVQSVAAEDRDEKMIRTTEKNASDAARKDKYYATATKLRAMPFNNPGDLLKQYRNGDEDVGDTFKSVGEYNKLLALANDESGASDVQMIYAFAKMMDPRGAVRDTDAALVQKASGYLQGLGNKLIGAVNGQKFDAETRKQIVASAMTTMDEKISLRKELHHIRQERDILKKATAFFAKEGS
jgi:hypothetical protein